MAVSTEPTRASKQTDDAPPEMPDVREPRQVVRVLLDEFGRNDLLTYASAIAYQTLFAIVPLALAGLAMLGFLDLEEVWQRDVAPHVQERVSTDAFQVIEKTVEKILGSGQGFWLTLGLALAIWEVSGAVRAVMGVLGRIYRAPDDRSFWRRLVVSIGLALAVAGGLGGAVAAIQLGPRAAAMVGDSLAVTVVSGIVRWVIALALALLVVGLLVRYGPGRRQPVKWVSFGSALIVGAWVVSSLVFGWYLTSVANYASIFGSLAAVIVLMTYLYISALAFVVGAQIDALIRAQAGAFGGTRRGG